MPELYRVASEITRLLESRHEGDRIGLIRAKGEIATKAGFLVSLITPNDPDDPQKIQRLREAAKQLGIAL